MLIHTHTPVDEKSHVWRVIVNCPAHHMSHGDPNKSTAKRVAEMFPEVAAEDEWALEQQQQMFAYPDEGYSEVFLKPDWHCAAPARFSSICCARSRWPRRKPRNSVSRSSAGGGDDVGG